MKISNASAHWEGDLSKGKGGMKLGKAGYEGKFSFSSRFENGEGTNPEELLGAALAGCYSMFLSAILSKDGHVPTRIDTIAKVHLGDGPKVELFDLSTEAVVPGIDEKTFEKYAEEAKKNCPVSVALGAVDKKLTAKLVK